MYALSGSSTIGCFLKDTTVAGTDHSHSHNSRTLKRIKAELRRGMHRNPYEVAEWLGRVLDGWLRYYAVPNSYPSLQRFTHRLRMMWLRVLRRRSHMDRTRLDKLGRYAAASWPPL